MLTYALGHFVSEPFLEAFRQSLRLRLTGDSRLEVEEYEARLKKLKTSQDRLSRMLVDLTDDDAILQQRYEETRQKFNQTREHLFQLKTGLQMVDAKVVEAQLQVDPRQLIQGLFDSGQPPQRLRTVLARLFPSVVFEGKEGRYLSTFRIRFAPGVALAMASGTEAISESELEARLILRYYPSNQKIQSGYWTVDVLETLRPLPRPSTVVDGS